MKSNFLVFFTLSQLYKNRVHLGVIKPNLNVNAFRYLLPIKNSFSLINLHYTSTLLKVSFHYLLKVLMHRGTVLVINESKFLSTLLKRELDNLNQPISYHSWSAGLLSNFKAVRRNSLKTYFLKRQFILKLFRLDALGLLNSKTRNVIKSSFNFLKFRKELNRYIRSLNRLPNVVFAFDCVLSDIPLQEAKKLSIASFGISDSNSDSFNLNYGIPGNSTSILSLLLYFRFLKLIFLKGMLLERRNFLTNTLAKKKQFRGLNFLITQYKGNLNQLDSFNSVASFNRYFLRKGYVLNPFLNFYNQDFLSYKVSAGNNIASLDSYRLGMKRLFSDFIAKPDHGVSSILNKSSEYYTNRSEFSKGLFRESLLNGGSSNSFNYASYINYPYVSSFSAFNDRLILKATQNIKELTSRLTISSEINRALNNRQFTAVSDLVKGVDKSLSVAVDREISHCKYPVQNNLLF